MLWFGLFLRVREVEDELFEEGSNCFVGSRLQRQFDKVKVNWSKDGSFRI